MQWFWWNGINFSACIITRKTMLQEHIFQHTRGQGKINGLLQNCSISSSSAMVILQSCTKPSKWLPFLQTCFTYLLECKLCYFYSISLKFVAWVLTDNKSAFVQVMALCRQASSHYQKQWWFIIITLKYITLPQWGRVTHIFVSKLTIIGSDNGLSSGWHQAIIWINDGIMSIGPLGTNLSEIFIKIDAFSFKKILFENVVWKMVAILPGHFVSALMCQIL